jgi:hypothetical protein
MKKITVFQDENASYCFIIGTHDPEAAEAALRKQEEFWYGSDESKWDGRIEKRMPFDAFYSMSFAIRGEQIGWHGHDLPPGKGRVAIREGFMAPLD